jgi:hypothetical protein
MLANSQYIKMAVQTLYSKLCGNLTIAIMYLSANVVFV